MLPRPRRRERCGKRKVGTGKNTLPFGGGRFLPGPPKGMPCVREEAEPLVLWLQNVTAMRAGDAAGGVFGAPRLVPGANRTAFVEKL